MKGILMAEENIYPAPDRRSEILYDLTAGEKLKITDSLDKWYQVELINREKGWILKDNIEKI
ncbi:MAG: SH3 domain-containing protein [Ignavibacteriales bacterium]|nr:SH3 domain-containing protein [Ignavibacteriales bacterium]